MSNDGRAKTTVRIGYTGVHYLSVESDASQDLCVSGEEMSGSFGLLSSATQIPGYEPTKSHASMPTI